MAASRLGRGLVALAASAITAVYAAGYVHTDAADQTLGTASAAPVARTGPDRAAQSQPTVVRVQPTATPRTTAPSQTFKDGTYTGTGTSRRGDVLVSLSIQSGRIASVNITHATTQYPTRFIANLPGEVVSRQTPKVDVISGATYSSLAFQGAVQQALQHAQV